MNIKTSFLLSFFCISLISCTPFHCPPDTRNSPTVVESSNYTDILNLSSEPSGAKIYVNEVLVGTTPSQVRLNFSERRIQYREVQWCNSAWGGSGVWTDYDKKIVNPEFYTIKVYKDGYKVHTFDASFNWGTSYSKVVFLESSGPDIDLRLKIRQPQ